MPKTLTLVDGLAISACISREAVYVPPYEEPNPIEQEVILGAVITVVVIGTGLGLQIYFIKRR